MRMRAELLNLLTEVRGRLDELERLVRLGSDFAIPTPQSFEEMDVEDITPHGYLQFRQTGLQGSRLHKCFTPLNDFMQFAAPNVNSQCEVADFALSDLHRNDSAPGFGLTIVALGDKQEWFAFEFLSPDLDPKAWQWTEWVLKISSQAPSTIFSQFILHGEGDPSFVVLGSHEVNEYATFFHFRLDRGMVPSEKLLAMQQVRLVLSTGGNMIGLNIYAFGVYGVRSEQSP